MLNTPVQAAAEGMPASKSITRRAALCGIASIPALGGATAAAAAISASADPWTRARALAGQIKATLSEIDGVHDVDVTFTLDHMPEGHAFALDDQAHPDAELLAIGNEFDALRAKSDAAWWEWQALEDQFESMDPAPHRHATAEEFNAWVRRRFTSIAATDLGCKEREVMLNELDAIAKRVRAIQPKTIAGLAVWGKCLARDCMNPGDLAAPLNEVDFDKEQIRGFIAVLGNMAATASLRGAA